MKRSIQAFALIIFAFLVVVPPAAFSEVKISLKNGRDIIADSCREVKDELICEIMGGTFVIGKKDVGNIKEFAVKRQERLSRPEDSADLSGENQGSSKENSGVKEERKSGHDSGSQAEVGFNGELSPDIQRRLDQIIRKKEQLRAEREEIVREREQLNEDVKNEGVIKSREQFEELSRRIAELDEKAKSFNEEAAGLSRDERKITEELNSQGK